MEIQVCVLVYEEWYVHIYTYISSLSYNSLGSFIQQRTTIFIIFRSSSSFSPSSHFFVWMQISSLRYCFPWSLPLYSAVSPRLLFHPRHACACAYIRVCLCPYFRRMYRCILSNVFHSFFLDFLFSIPFRRSSIIFRPLYFVLEKSTYQRARDRFESILCWKVFFQYIYLEQ